MRVTARKNSDNPPYSLHDMSINGMRAEGDRLLLEFGQGFVEIAGRCRQVAGRVEFASVDWELSYVYLLDFPGNEGCFSGQKLFLRDFIRGCRSLNFVVMDETYGFHLAKLSGYLSEKESLKECFIEICYTGDMRYIAEE
jgi:hypothetical protein